MKEFLQKNILFIIILIKISLIYSKALTKEDLTKLEIPIYLFPDLDLPTVEASLGPEAYPNHYYLDISQDKSWEYKNIVYISGPKNSKTLKFGPYSVKGEEKKAICQLSKDKDIRVDNFKYLEVNELTGEEPFLNLISLNTIINNIEVFKNDIRNKNYGFNIDFPSKKLIIGTFEDNEKGKKLDLKEYKWKFKLNAIILDDINKNEKVGNVYKMSNKTEGTIVNKFISLETIFAPFYVSKDFFEYLENSNYFYDGKEQLCERTILNRHIVFLCDKSKKDKIKNINLVLNEKYVLPLTKDYLLKCADNSNICEFNIKFNPKVDSFALGVDILRQLNIHFMKNDNSVYIKGIDLLECDLSGAALHKLGQKDKIKALFQLLKTFSVIVSIFIVLFIFFYLHSKFRGHLYEDKEDEEKKGKELVDIDDKEKN